MGFSKTCKTRDLAGLFGISDRRVRQLVQEKVLTQKSRDTFEVAANVHAYIAFREHAVATEAGRYAGLSRERAGLVKVQRELAEVELDERLGNTVLISDAREIISRHLLIVKNKMLGLSARLAPLANPGAPLVAQEVIYSVVVEVLEELSTLETYNGARSEPPPPATQ